MALLAMSAMTMAASEEDNAKAASVDSFNATYGRPVTIAPLGAAKDDDAVCDPEDKLAASLQREELPTGSTADAISYTSVPKDNALTHLVDRFGIKDDKGYNLRGTDEQMEDALTQHFARISAELTFCGEELSQIKAERTRLQGQVTVLETRLALPSLTGMFL